ncbi:MraY family glycosyltransferase [Paramuribaculum intestinale]|uniref:Undecaprenyl/decaprenyl-phosphate alpha-N-acetylglucosaminyl 1-phosphate transferase n=1 Tax=Paramuribaculum intestinale TaxID=2094151 RepID=A0A2V1IY34_9BACT|nr:MraY family glycosyltransferase [Paramuribaculum intestinale]PWB07582.1 undecaprenyl/decaprenyl-phosphate alpha-N-acetylglucosaminyl 1-phosphate transferase [Paramuribaculum intestinale]PWB10959.1 undecaprenyl/decaprenyl-phosphate alpha-N-acetylglucosaminyl 1-phosphate transferase [Paramuribaculum intestinale]ROS94458.1 undecaprenyl/decaprenyl-phosphate alpha-N-acetylglucosaminyl 1-phosphate transferase [Muribaculaceae bacterium Isolate-043 (Harlan)]WLT41877.1 undecaprenyl/decaprenyl-phospha
MTTWIICCFLSTLLSVLFAGILIPQILLVSYRRKLFDMPDERKIHRGTVPRLGGIAFTPVILFSVSLLLGMSILMGNTDMENMMRINAQAISFGLCALLLMYLTGMSDDLIGVRYRAKFVVQIFCAVLLIGAGMYVNDLHGIIGLGHISPWFGIPLTILIVVYVVNAINLIDGIDGLASGLSSAAFIIYGTAFLMIGKPIFAMLSFACLGVLIQFFYYNVFGSAERKKKIFMGDTGSLTIGLLLAFLGLALLQWSPDKFPTFRTNPMILAVSPLIIPCFDVVRVFLHRVRRHGNPFLPDKTHIHHKMLAIGLNQRLAMVLIVVASITFSIANILLSRYIEVNLLLILDILLWTLANLWLTRHIRSRERRLGVKLMDHENPTKEKDSDNQPHNNND